jgi:hypothetical protein
VIVSKKKKRKKGYETIVQRTQRHPEFEAYATVAEMKKAGSVLQLQLDTKESGRNQEGRVKKIRGKY